MPLFPMTPHWYVINGTSTTIDDDLYPDEVFERDLLPTPSGITTLLSRYRNIPCEAFELILTSARFYDRQNDYENLLVALRTSSQLRQAKHLTIRFRHFDNMNDERQESDGPKPDEDVFYAQILQLCSLPTKTSIKLSNYPGRLEATMDLLVQELTSLEKLEIETLIEVRRVPINRRNQVMNEGYHLCDIEQVCKILSKNKNHLSEVHFSPLLIVTGNSNDTFALLNSKLMAEIGACPSLSYLKYKLLTWNYNYVADPRAPMSLTVSKRQNYVEHERTPLGIFKTTLGHVLTRIKRAYCPHLESVTLLPLPVLVLALAAASTHPNALYYILRERPDIIYYQFLPEETKPCTPDNKTVLPKKHNKKQPPSSPTKRSRRTNSPHSFLHFPVPPRKNPTRQARVRPRLRSSRLVEDSYSPGGNQESPIFTLVKFADHLHLSTTKDLASQRAPADICQPNLWDMETIHREANKPDPSQDRTRPRYQQHHQPPTYHLIPIQDAFRCSSSTISLLYQKDDLLRDVLFIKASAHPSIEQRQTLPNLSMELLLAHTVLPIPCVTVIKFLPFSYLNTYLHHNFLRDSTAKEFAIFLRMIRRCSARLTTFCISLPEQTVPKDDARLAAIIQLLPSTLTEIVIENVNSDLPRTLTVIQKGSFHLSKLSITGPASIRTHSAFFMDGNILKPPDPAATIQLPNSITSVLLAHRDTLTEIVVERLPIMDEAIEESTIIHRYGRQPWPSPSKSKKKCATSEVFNILRDALPTFPHLTQLALTLNIFTKWSSSFREYIYDHAYGYHPVSTKIARACSLVRPNQPYHSNTIADLRPTEWFSVILRVSTSQDCLLHLFMSDPQRITFLPPENWLQLLVLFRNSPHFLAYVLDHPPQQLPPQQLHPHPLVALCQQAQHQHNTHYLNRSNQTIGLTIALFAMPSSTLFQFDIDFRYPRIARPQETATDQEGPSSREWWP